MRDLEMVAKAAKIKTDDTDGISGPDAGLHVVWVGAKKAQAQLSSAGHYYDSGCKEIARHAAMEGVVTLRLVLSSYTAGKEFRAYADWERDYSRAPSQDVYEREPDTFSDTAVRNIISACATEIRACAPMPNSIRDELSQSLCEIADCGAGAVLGAIAECAIAERVLKANRS